MGAVSASARAQWQQKVDAGLWHSAEMGGTDFLVMLAEQADLSDIDPTLSKDLKGEAVYARKAALAERTQASLLAELDRAGVAYRRYWILNMVWVRGDATLLEQLARRPDVASIHANPSAEVDVVTMAGAISAEMLPQSATSSPEWQLELVNAPTVWEAGVRGAGVVVGGQDTGYQWDHPALKNQYRGWDASSELVDHRYSWHDAIHENNPLSAPGNQCGFDISAPCDDHGHGTHTMGTMVGDDGGFQIGMAPDAQWIACRNMDDGWGSPASYIECFEWFIAPYPQDGDPFTDGRPDLAPDVVNNSWACWEIEGCTQPDMLREAVGAVRAAGILTVQAASNNGPGCSTIYEPAAIYDDSFSVGATDSQDSIASFSSRGPVTVIDDAGLKPDLVAPGVSLLSSRPNDGYGYSSGTSMAAPMVAGLAALLIDADPALAGQVDQLETIMRTSAESLTTLDGCGGDTAESVPNHTYGHGRIDAWAAYQLVVGDAPTQLKTYLPFVR